VNIVVEKWRMRRWKITYLVGQWVGGLVGWRAVQEEQWNRYKVLLTEFLRPRIRRGKIGL
jgi:hypothetical protein